jgi:hypothetical protein
MIASNRVRPVPLRTVHSYAEHACRRHTLFEEHIHSSSITFQELTRLQLVIARGEWSKRNRAFPTVSLRVVPSGAFVRLTSVLFVCDSILE